jgi:hypothetical protein
MNVVYLMRYFLLLVCLGCSLCTFAQRKSIIDELRVVRQGQGQIVIHQDARIDSLLGTKFVKATGSAEPNVLKARGYRVQVFAGNNSRIARQEANDIAEEIRKEFPDLSVYAFFQPPRWLCRVGDYRSIEEADVVMRRLKATGKFKEVSIVREQINILID